MMLQRRNRNWETSTITSINLHWSVTRTHFGFHGFSITHPEFDKLEKNDDPISTGEVIPLYPLTNEFKSVGIDQRIFRKVIKEALSYKLNIPEIYSSEVLKNYALISLSEALQNIHYSSSNNRYTLRR